ncbi:pilus assembly protein [Sinorhizobium sp. A49]|nr:pilus assembly protein [Sinorhizobium sp. A49]
MLARTRNSIALLAKDRSGFGAIEFAMVIPMLVVAYIGAFEVTLGFTVKSKVERAASSVADMIAQQSEVNKTYLGNMSNVAKSILAPYQNSGFTLKMTGIKVDAANNGTVVWSRDQNGAIPYAANSPTTVPAQFASTEAFVVRTELVVPHELLLFAEGLNSSTLKTINLSKTAYFRSRQAEIIKCPDC